MGVHARLRTISCSWFCLFSYLSYCTTIVLLCLSGLWIGWCSLQLPFLLLPYIRFTTAVCVIGTFAIIIIILICRLGVVIYSVVSFIAMETWVYSEVVSTQRLSIGIWCFTVKHGVLRNKYGIRMICMCEAECLPVNSCFSEIA